MAVKKNISKRRDVCVTGKRLNYSQKADKEINETNKEVAKIEKEMRTIQSNMKLLL